MDVPFPDSMSVFALEFQKPWFKVAVSAVNSAGIVPVTLHRGMNSGDMRKTLQIKLKQF